MHELTLTGERTLPGIWHESYWFRRHEVAYLALAPYVRDAAVLEAGCGEGYGADLLAREAARVLALDYDAPTVAHVRSRYPDVDVVRGDLQRLPIADARLDAVVSLQVIEHLWDQPGFLRECARVLRPDGALLVSTPNRLTFSPGRETPLNPFHTRELSPGELRELLEAYFSVARLLGVHHGARLRAWEREHAGPGGIVAGQLAGPPREWPAALREAVAGVTAADFELREDDVASSLDLVAVAHPRSTG